MAPVLTWRKDGLQAGAVFFAFAAVFLLAAGAGVDDVVGDPRWDMPSIFAHARGFLARSLREGSLPLWNPHAFCGTPFMAQPESAVFYPPNLLFAVLPLGAALNASMGLHLGWCGLGAYVLARVAGVRPSCALMAGLVYMFGAPTALQFYPGHLSNLCVMSWTPWVLACVHRIGAPSGKAWAAGGAAALACQILAGHPQYLFYGCLFYALYASLCLGRLASDAHPRRGAWAYGPGDAAARLALMAALGVAAAAVQLAPTLELAAGSARARLPYGYCASYSLPPENLLTLLRPEAFGGLEDYSGRGFYLWEMCLYVGLAPLAAALLALARRRTFVVASFGGLALLSVALAFGGYTPLFRFLYDWVPGFDLFRGNAKFIHLTSLCLAVLAAVGVEVLSDLFPGGKGSAGAVAAGLALALALFDLWSAWLPGLRTFPIGMVRAGAGMAGVLTSGAVAPRVSWLEAPSLWLHGMLDGIQHVGGVAPVIPWRNSAFVNAAAGLPLDSPRDHVSVDRVGPLTALVDMRYVVAPEPRGQAPPPAEVLRPVLRAEGFVVYEDPRAGPRAFVAHRQVVEERAGAAWRMIAGGLVDPRAVAVVEEDAGLPAAAPGVKGPASRVAVRVYEPERVVLDVESDAAGLAVLADAFAPGWEATVDGVDARVLPVDGLLRGVRIPKGRSTVEFRYRPKSFLRGAALSGASLAAGLLLLVL